MSTSVLLTNSKSQPRNFLDMRHGFVCHLFSACFSWSWAETYGDDKFMVDDLPEVYRALAYHQSSRLHIMFSTFALGKNQERLSHRTLCWRSALSKAKKATLELRARIEEACGSCLTNCNDSVSWEPLVRLDGLMALRSILLGFSENKVISVRQRGPHGAFSW